MPHPSRPIAAPVASCAAQLAPAPQNLFTGTSGWAYPGWKPGFYPAEVPARAFLQYYAAHLTAVEVNYTFRQLPTRPQLEGWLAATPPGFRFSFKAPQRITHFARLRDCSEALERFFAALEPAREAAKLGPLLFQLPPNFKADHSRLQLFLHDPNLRVGDTPRGALRIAPRGAPRIAFEFRHDSWFTEDTYTLLREHGAALCVADTDDLSTPDVVTADFRCYRLRRDGGYKRAELKRFAERFTALATAGEIYAFFRHQEEPTGALNASAMLKHAAKLAGLSSRKVVAR